MSLFKWWGDELAAVYCVSEAHVKPKDTNVTSQCTFDTRLRVPSQMHCWLNVAFLLVWVEPGGWGCLVDSLQVGGHSSCVRGGQHKIKLELVSEGGHFFGVSHCRRGWAFFQLAWGLYQGMCVTGGLGGAVHCATPSASKAERQSDTICVVDCGMVLLGTACFYLLPSLFVDHILSSRNTCRCAMCVWSYQDTE